VGAGMGDDVAAILLTLAAENAELHEQLAAMQDMLMETAIDAGQLHARVEELLGQRDAWRAEAERLSTRGIWRA
jgi:regulator of replication initiation timing